jgi:hypothetical protein
MLLFTMLFEQCDSEILLTACFAFVWFITRMSSHVIRFVSNGPKSFITVFKGTLERLLSGVSPFVVLQVDLLSEHTIAELAS